MIAEPQQKQSPGTTEPGSEPQTDVPIPTSPTPTPPAPTSPSPTVTAQTTGAAMVWNRWRWQLIATGTCLMLAWFLWMPRPTTVPSAQTQRGSMMLTIAASGKVDGDSSDLSFMGSGKIIEESVREGDSIEKGQVLARINRSDYAGTDDVIQSPYDGYVVTVYRRVGEIASPNTPVLRVVRRGGIYVTTFFDSEDAAWVHRGDRFVCRAGGYLARPWDLQVESIGQEAVQRDDVVGSARQVRARLAILDSSFALPIGTDVDVDGEVQIALDTLQIPASAVVRQENRTLVWRIADGKVQPVDVTLGPNNFRFVAIKSGLEEGDVVVLERQADLNPGQRVRVQFLEDDSS